jgi:hypothetical protein
VPTNGHSRLFLAVYCAVGVWLYGTLLMLLVRVVEGMLTRAPGRARDMARKLSMTATRSMVAMVEKATHSRHRFGCGGCGARRRREAGGGLFRGGGKGGGLLCGLCGCCPPWCQRQRVPLAVTGCIALLFYLIPSAALHMLFEPWQLNEVKGRGLRCGAVRGTPRD